MKFSLFFIMIVYSMGVMAQRPEFERLKTMIRREHPRLFLTPEQQKHFKEHAARLPEILTEYRRQVDAVPDRAKLAIKPGTAEVRDDKLIFLTRFPGQMQNDGTLVIQYPGGHLSLKSAIVYLASGERKYFDKAVEYMLLTVEFAQWCDHYRIMPEWWHTERLSALVAYDWLYNELTPEIRRAFIVPMLEHVKHIQNVKYQVCRGVPNAGNYGEPGLLWFVGLVGFGDGIADAEAENLLKKGYRINREVMEYREKVSAGSGLLGTTTVGYALGFYPYASCNFLLSLLSAADFDAREIYPQMREYPRAVYYQLFPDYLFKNKLCSFGWGDEYHRFNRVAGGMLYSHMAQVIHLYGERDPETAAGARAVIGLLPEEERHFGRTTKHYAYLPFVLDGFDPKSRLETPQEAFGNTLAAHFPSFGLTAMRSGYGENETYASFKGGSRESNHQHFDENSFIIYRKGFQTLDSGERGLALHNGVYYTQTIAHNSILIRMEKEPIGKLTLYPKAKNLKVEEPVYCDGGQYKKNAAKALKFDQSEYHVSAGSDATACYRMEKCREAVRQFVYIKPDFFVIYDRVESVGPEQQKVFLLHTQNEPVKSAAGVWRGTAGDGAIFLRTLLPLEVNSEVIGGHGREFFTNGRNWEINDHANMMAKHNWFGRYRLEISPKQAEAKNRFLTVLQATDASTAQMIPFELINKNNEDGVRFEYDGKQYEVHFCRNGAIGGSIEVRRNNELLMKRKLSEK